MAVHYVLLHRVILVPRSLNSGFPLLGAERTSLLWSLTGG
jgi:hypothetical protein